MKKILGALFSLVVSSAAMAEAPILLVGASYANASTPFNDVLQAPQGGTSVNNGDFLSLGNALVRHRKLSGHVINEAQAGATTFDRRFCRDVCFEGPLWQGYDKQLTKALARVTAPDQTINAQYVLISLPNDCLHSGAMGIPHSETSPCSIQQLNEHADRLVHLGQRILDKGLTPVFLNAPRYDDLDLPFFGQQFQLQWVIGSADYALMTSIRHQRISNDLDGAVQLDVWKGFKHIGDGIHPNRKSTKRAARRIARFIRANE